MPRQRSDADTDLEAEWTHPDDIAATLQRKLAALNALRRQTEDLLASTDEAIISVEMKSGVLAPQSLGEWIAALLKRTNLTRPEIAEAIGVSPAALSLWSRGKNVPSILNLGRLVVFVTETTGVSFEIFWADLGRVIEAEAKADAPA